MTAGQDKTFWPRASGLPFHNGGYVQKRRMVIKAGTGALRGSGHPSEQIFWSIASQIAEIKKEKWEVVLVTSGAVDAGKEWLTLLGRDFSMLNEGELSSIGTSRLLGAWEKAFLRHGLAVATGWLTHSDFGHRTHRRNLRVSCGKLSGLYAVPVINENDLLSRSELSKMRRGTGDNDYLARRVACLLNAGAILFLTESGGIFNRSPSEAGACMYVELDGRKTFRLRDQDGGKSKTGTGGPQSKINQASICFRRGMRAAIAGVREPRVIVRFANGELVGTTISCRTILGRSGRTHSAVSGLP